MLTLIENEMTNVNLKTQEVRQAPFGPVLHSYSSESVENVPSVSYFKDLGKKTVIYYLARAEMHVMRR